jgi:hypothetical protein
LKPIPVVREVGIGDFRVAIIQHCSHLDHCLLPVARRTVDLCLSAALADRKVWRIRNQIEARLRYERQATWGVCKCVTLGVLAA